MLPSGLRADDYGVSERGLHQIEDDLSETWLEYWAGAGVAEIESYLAKYAAFLSFLDSQEASVSAAASPEISLAGMKLSYLWRGLPGHPIHPPLTDATVGVYTFATVAALADVTGISNNAATHGWWLALLFGLIATVATATTGFLDWLTIEWGTELWK